MCFEKKRYASIRRPAHSHRAPAAGGAALELALPPVPLAGLRPGEGAVGRVKDAVAAQAGIAAAGGSRAARGNLPPGPAARRRSSCSRTPRSRRQATTRSQSRSRTSARRRAADRWLRLAA